MYRFLLPLLFFAAACNNAADNNNVLSDSSKTGTDSTRQYVHHFADTALSSRITDTLMKLSFVHDANDYIDSLTNHQHGISFLIDSSANDPQGISVQAGYNRDDRFETYYRFFVNPKNLAIKVYDVVNDTALSVKDFIKMQNRP